MHDEEKLQMKQYITWCLIFRSNLWCIQILNGKCNLHKISFCIIKILSLSTKIFGNVTKFSVKWLQSVRKQKLQNQMPAEFLSKW